VSAADTELSHPSYILLRVLIDEGPSPMGRLASMAHMDVVWPLAECNPWSTPDSSRDALIPAMDGFASSTQPWTANVPREHYTRYEGITWRGRFRAGRWPSSSSSIAC
jgi:hypothetical protein